MNTRREKNPNSESVGEIVRPSEFPFDSRESRAAARAVVLHRDRVDLQFVVDVEHIANPDRPLERRSYRCLSDGKTVEVVIVERGER